MSRSTNWVVPEAEAATGDLTAPVKLTDVADVIDGHVHPALCVAQNGDVLAVYNKQGGGGKHRGGKRASFVHGPQV